MKRRKISLELLAPIGVQVIFIALLSALSFELNGQVISNTGANIVNTGSNVFSRDLENTTGNLRNDGTFTLTNNLNNSAVIGGNGSYLLKGNWTDLGTFNPGTSHVTFNGIIGDQTITHNSSGETFYNLTLTNPFNITQISAPGGSLSILNDLNLSAGNLNLHSTTLNLTVNHAATVAGNLVYNNATLQTATIGGNLTGPGTIDMRGGNLAHILNLAGAINQIGTFLTSNSPSVVNYNGAGPTQTVFPALNYRHLIISNGGIKTLQGNSRVNLDLNISGGTFDLGTVPTSFDVFGNTLITAGLEFNGTSVKTVNLFGNLGGAGSIDMSGGNLAHFMNLNGSLNSIGTYSSGSSSTVVYTLNGIQTLFASNDYRNLTISGTNTKSLLGDVNAKGILTMAAGDINAGPYIMEVSNPALSSINRTSGKVIGRLRRSVALTTGEYLYPVGALNYNPFKIRFQNLNAGSLTVHFNQEDIGNAGLPMDDNGNEIFDRYSEGYWTLTSSSSSLSNNFNIKVDFNGFPGIDASSSIIKRTDSGNLEVDGVHGTLTASEISRNNLVNGISTGTTDIAIGRGRPRIYDQPDNIDICETFNAFFEVDANGRGTLTYQWEVSTNGGATFTPLTDSGVYSNTDEARLDITGAPFTMNGYMYRCVITDGQGHSNVTRVVLLTVNKIPVADASIPAPECPGIAFDNITLWTSNGVIGTTFAWSRTNPAGISTALPLTGQAIGDLIAGSFNNTTDDPITIVFTIIPTGPGTTFCVGDAITRTVTVNPSPRVFATPANSTQCDNTATNIRLSSPSHFTSGVVSFRYTVTTSGDVTGFISPSSGMLDEHYITDILVNNTNTYHTVTYRVVPESPVGCAEGMPATVQVTVNPTPKAEPLNNTPAICYGGNTQIILTTPTTMTTGLVVFDYTVSATGGGVVTGDMTPGNDIANGQTIYRSYQNSSHDLQTVTYTIIPVNNSICAPGPAAVSTVQVHAIPIWGVTQTKALICDAGAGLGALRAELSTGAAPYHIVWNGPDNYHMEDMVEINNLSSGGYYINVTDNLGCPGSDVSYLVPQPAGLYNYAYPKLPKDAIGSHLSCIGSDDGTIRISVQSGISAPYNYSLVRNDTEIIGTGVFNANLEWEEYEDLAIGVYNFIVTDTYGCVTSKKSTVRAPEPIAVIFGRKTYSGGFNVSCRGYNDGSVWVETVGGGRPGYTYLWSTADGSIPGPVNTYKIDNVTAGTYNLEVTDFLGCKAYFSYTVTQPEGMDLTFSQLSLSNDSNYNISCNGGNDGSISMTIQGGSGSYIYTWTGPNGFTSDQEDPTGLRAGTYNCTVRDLNGCILTPSPAFTLTEPTPLQVSTVSSVSNDGAYQINCHGGTGSVSATASGGSVNNYSYTWTTADGSGIVQGMQNQTALTAGTYHLLVQDYNKCIVEKDITLTEPADLTLTLTPKHITCEIPGFNNGSVDLSVAGGAGSVTYLWSNGATTQDISGLTAGTYQVDVTYNNTCTVSGSSVINLPAPITYDATYSNYNSYEVSCYGRSDGEIHIVPTSGKAPFTYSLQGPGGYQNSLPDITGLRAGIYNLVITDANLCTARERIDMREPGELEARFVVSQSLSGGFNLNCAGDSTGTISINPQNSVNNVDYLWSDGFMGRTRNNLKAGEYTVVLTDDNNCQAIGTTTLTQPDSIKLAFEIRQPFCPDMPDGEIRLNVSGGVPGAEYSYRWSDNSTRNILSEISTGEYKVIVEDLNRCVVRDSLMLQPQNEACLIVPNMISPNGDLINDYWNIGMKELYPKMEVKIFNRWGETVWRSEKGYPDPWDGRSRGTLLPIDSYHYIIDLHNGKKPIIGNVTLVK